MSEDYSKLFETSKKITTPSQFITEEKFGKQSTRVTNLKDKEVLYIGVESSNELYSGLHDVFDSYYSISTKMLRPNDKGDAEKFTFSHETRDIQVRDDPSDDNFYLISWSEIYLKQQKTTLTPTLVPVKDVTYKLYGGTNPLNALNMNSLCSIEHANKSEVFSIFYVYYEDKQLNEIKINKAELERVKVLGIIAMFNDPESGDIVTLAYEPFSFVHAAFGVKVSTEHLAVIGVLSAGVIVLLLLVVCCLRRKSKML